MGKRPIPFGMPPGDGVSDKVALFFQGLKMVLKWRPPRVGVGMKPFGDLGAHLQAIGIVVLNESIGRIKD